MAIEKITVWQRSGDYPINPYQITSHPDVEAEYVRLKELANKYGSRNKRAEQIGDLLRTFTRAICNAAANVNADERGNRTIEIDLAPLTEAQAIDAEARANKATTYQCIARGCQNRATAPNNYCARCAHDA